MRTVFLRLSFLLINLQCAALMAENAVIPDVVVKANNVYRSMHDSAKQLITNQQINAGGSSSLPLILNELGGIQLHNNSGISTQANFSMRGFGANASSNTLVLLNGIPLTNPDMSSPDINAIPIHEIKYIEIIAGSESVMYGDQAVGGLINIVTNKADNHKIEASCTGGSYNSKSCTAAISKQYRQVHYRVDALSNYSDNYREQSKYHQNLIAASALYENNDNKLDVSMHLAKDYMQFPGALTAEQVAENRQQATNDTDYFRDDNGLINAKLSTIIKNGWQIETTLARREMHGNGILSTPFTQQRSLNFLQPKMKGKIKNISITSGIDYENDDYDLNTDFGETVDHQQKIGIFGLANTPLWPQTMLSFGARGAGVSNQLQTFSTANTVNKAVATTIGISYQILTNADVYLRRATSFRFPKADENAFTSSDVNGLKTQRGISYETGLKWKYLNSSYKLDIYQLNLRDEIAFDPLQTPQNPFGVNTNYSPTVRRGFSFSDKYHVNPNIIISGQYHYVDARFQSGTYAGNRIPLVAENLVLGNINYALNNHFNVYTEAVYTGNEYSDNDNANNDGKIGGYTVYNVNLRYHWQHFSAAFRVDNIFNKYYYLYTVVTTGAPSQYFYPAPARTFSLNIKISD